MKNLHSKFWLAAAFVFVAGVLRILLADIPNFSPVAALALFGGAYFADKRAAFTMPLLVMLFSDIALEFAFMAGWRQYGGFHNIMPFVYAGFLLTVFLGTFLKDRIKFIPVAAAGLLSSILFFVITNFGVWITGGYPATLEGLIFCYDMAIPFFKYTLIGDLFFISVFFISFELVKTLFLKPAKA